MTIVSGPDEAKIVRMMMMMMMEHTAIEEDQTLDCEDQCNIQMMYDKIVHLKLI